MPQRKNIPSYRLHKPSGQARVIIDGQHVYLGPYGSEESKAECEWRVRELLRRRADAELEAKVQVSNDLTVAELVAAYLKYARGYHVKHGRLTPQYDHICSAIAAVTADHGSHLVTAIGPLKRKALRRRWVDHGHGAVGLRRRVDFRLGGPPPAQAGGGRHEVEWPPEGSLAQRVARRRDHRTLQCGREYPRDRAIAGRLRPDGPPTLDRGRSREEAAMVTSAGRAS
jgi:hypothetical protein